VRHPEPVAGPGHGGEVGDEDEEVIQSNHGYLYTASDGRN
jgi:hypothetical protein